MSPSDSPDHPGSILYQPFRVFKRSPILQTSNWSGTFFAVSYKSKKLHCNQKSFKKVACILKWNKRNGLELKCPLTSGFTGVTFVLAGGSRSRFVPSTFPRTGPVPE